MNASSRYTVLMGNPTSRDNSLTPAPSRCFPKATSRLNPLASIPLVVMFLFYGRSQREAPNGQVRVKGLQLPSWGLRLPANGRVTDGDRTCDLRCHSSSEAVPVCASVCSSSFAGSLCGTRSNLSATYRLVPAQLQYGSKPVEIRPTEKSHRDRCSPLNSELAHSLRELLRTQVSIMSHLPSFKGRSAALVPGTP